MSLLDALKKAGLVSAEKAQQLQVEKRREEEKAAKDNLTRLSQPPTKRDGPEAGE